MGKIFISYARKDAKSFAEDLSNDLKKHGLDVWWDYEAMESRGRTFLQEIRDAIWDAERLIAVITPEGLESDYVRFEWEYAYIFDTAVIPILRKGDYESIPEKFQNMISWDQFQKLSFELTASEFSNLHCPDFRDDKQYKKTLRELVRILETPVDPLAPFHIRPPALPQFYFYRHKEIEKLTFDVLRDSRLPEVAKIKDRTFALHGKGGSGKSVLAAAFTRAIAAGRYFKDGVFWLQIGQEGHNLIGHLESIRNVFETQELKYESLKDAQDRVESVLADKCCLIILDNVWNSQHAKIFMEASGSRCRLLLTTRVSKVATELGVPIQTLEQLSEDDALEVLASWAYKEKEKLPDIAKQIVEQCDRLPLALAICGGLIRTDKPYEDVLVSLEKAERKYFKQDFPEYSNEEIDVFTPLEVSLNALKAKDTKDKKNKEKCLHRYKHYLDLLVLPEGERTAEAVVLTMWLFKNGLNNRLLRLLARDLNCRALLQISGNWPLSTLMLHNLQQAFIRFLVRKPQNFHKKIARALLEWWHNSEKKSNLDTDEQKRKYVINHLLNHILEARNWNDLEKLFSDVSYLEHKQKPAKQYEFQQEFLSLLGNKNVAFRKKLKILKAVHDSILTGMKLGKEKADWLDTFGYWVRKFCEEVGAGKAMKPKASKELWNVYKKYSLTCGEVSHELAQDQINAGEHDWGLRYAELETWVYQRAGYFDRCVKACQNAEKMCLMEEMNEAYKILGKAEFVRMRAFAIKKLLEENPKAEYKVEADKAYTYLEAAFSDTEPDTWRPKSDDWKRIEIIMDSSAADVPDLLYKTNPERKGVFKAKVVSNEHDCISAIHIIQFFEDQDGEVEWIHHNYFDAEDFISKDRLFTVLLGGPKAPNISTVASNFYETDKDSWLEMYSGLFCKAHRLKIERKPTHCYMLGGISKINTLKAAYDFTQDNDVMKIIERKR